jgi:L-ascorbate metabolism protein UlaG (beta-lactamase superfamily)
MAVAARRLTTAVEVRLVYVGHATVLIEFPSIRVLTDPFFGLRLGPLRRHGPEPDLEAIGTVDIVLISHAHPDHFDRSSLRRLAGSPTIVVPAGLERAAKRAGHRVHGFRSGEELDIGGAMLTAIHARHWRSPLELRAEALGYVLDAGARVYFAGDTAAVRGISRKIGEVDVALLPVGTWGPHRGGPGHLDPEGAARLARDLAPGVAVPIHWGTLYPKGLERLLSRPLRQPGERFRDAAARLAPGVDVRVLLPGESATISIARHTVEPRVRLDRTTSRRPQQ